jgi:hypothetical protein
MSEQFEALVTEVEAARTLNLAVHTLRNWRARQVGPAYVKLGGAVRYIPGALRDYIQARTLRPVRRKGEAA